LHERSLSCARFADEEHRLGHLYRRRDSLQDPHRVPGARPTPRAPAAVGGDSGGSLLLGWKHCATNRYSAGAGLQRRFMQEILTPGNTAQVFLYIGNCSTVWTTARSESVQSFHS
jgi:hypothetical protein